MRSNCWWNRGGGDADEVCCAGEIVLSRGLVEEWRLLVGGSCWWEGHWREGFAVERIADGRTCGDRLLFSGAEDVQCHKSIRGNGEFSGNFRVNSLHYVVVIRMTHITVNSAISTFIAPIL